MKIMQVIPSLAKGFGGPSEAVLNLSLGLSDLGHEVSIFTTNADVEGGVLAVPLNEAVKLRNINIFYFPVQRPRHYKFSFALLMALKKHIPEFDIIHIHSLFQFSTLAASYYCRKYGKPHIIRPLGQLDPFLLKRNYWGKNIYINLFERKALEKASAVHFTTEEERAFSARTGLKFKGIVAELGLKLDEFNALPEYGIFRSKFPETKDKKIILFLGRINFKKGLDILVKSFSLLSRERHNTHLVIAGPDSEGYGSFIRELINSEGIASSVTFTGMLAGSDKLAAFKDSDIFVLPSYSENFGIAVVESMACGLPVVVSNKVGIHREILASESGIVVECGVRQLYDAMKLLLDDEGLRNKFSLNGRKLVKDKYDINKTTIKMLEVYSGLLQR